MSVRKLVHRTVDGFDVFIPVSDRNAWQLAADDEESYFSPIVIPDGWSDVFRKDANPFQRNLTIFMGPKGVGKSTLLTLKRALVEGAVVGFEPTSNTICLPTDRLAYHSSKGALISIRENSVGRATFSKLAPWIVLWRLLLAAFVLQADVERRQLAAGAAQSRRGSEDVEPLPVLPKSVLTLFAATNGSLFSAGICQHLSAAINSGTSETDLNSLYENELKPLLQKYIQPSKYCMFVDAVDEQLRGSDGLFVDVIQHRWLRPRAEGDVTVLFDEQAANYEENYNVWAYAQAGLLLASDDIFVDTNRRVRVYSTIRSEAVHAASERVSPAQIQTWCAHVTYSRQKLETIVRLNVAINVEKFRTERIFGDTTAVTSAKLDHAMATFFGGNSNFKAYGNHVRSWASEIVRFSMERPRELMMIGQSLSRLQQSANTGTTINEFIQAIENSLESVVNGFLDFIVGKTVAKEIRDKVLPYIPSTVLTRTQLENIERDVKTANCMLDHPMCKLFSLGLLGCVHRVSQTGHLIQEFAFHMAGNADLAIREISIPATSDVFLVHPALAHPLARGAPTLTLRRGGAAARDSTRMKSALLVISSNGIRAHRENAVSSCG